MNKAKKKMTVAVMLETEMVAQLDAQAEDKDLSRSQVVRHLLRDGLELNKKGSK